MINSRGRKKCKGSKSARGGGGPYPLADFDNREEQTPERHPKPFKNKPKIYDPDATSSASESQPMCTVKEPKGTSYKEIIDAIHKSNKNSTDSEDNFVQSCKPINTDLYSDTLDDTTGLIFFFLIPV